ncbi:protein ACCELERATED CELL DEATH 6 isoform X2 [Lactuca sativa]|uniref:protein ACCELERATED CELL DEATH 6 isoform X2 n=1 Tax=Lactuca sativa TaxID=4236 RepID=UPI000CB19031|nr:protein ACCELERATED CELL DEATH 6 isoform X2 [Lactuca sativa]
MASSGTFCSGTINQGSQQYSYPSHVNASSFLSVKLSSKTNYTRWQEQMMCLVESHDMLSFIDGTFRNPKKNVDSKKKVDITAIEDKYREWKRSDTLMKGWIFGSLCEDVMDTVIGLHTANDVWRKLKSTYSNSTPPSYSPTTNTKAILRGDWKEAGDIFNKDKDALLVKLNDDNDTPLHVAIGTCKNIQFVENLLKEITSESLPNMVNIRKSNPLHYAAFVGNKRASEMLVAKNPYLLFIADGSNCFPVHRAIFGSHTETFLYLLKVTKDNIILSEQEGYHSPFKGKQSVSLLTRVIGASLWDVAYGLIKEYPEMATKKKENSIPLKSVAGKLDGYFSGKGYNFYERFIYSHVLVEDGELNRGHEIQDIENQETNNANFIPKYRRRLHPVIQWIYVRFWKVSLQHVPHIKQIKEEKVNHNKALLLLKCICEQVSKINEFCKIREHYHEAITTAVEHDNPEAVEEIIRYFPQAISTKDNEYPLIQLAILNRCERVYNFLVHQITTDKHSQKVRVDEYGNNLLHLAGQLAPIHKLNLVSGAALQMQRELQWFEEVKSFACPWHEKSKNKNQETPIMVFRREHKKLRKEGEEWMKKTADSYTITAALIITIVFAAAITVPGGNDSDTGKAIYAPKPSFIIFAVSDAISLFTSTTSLLLFLSILTARYAEEDFLYKLPKRLILGLAMLFLSVSSMMVAFSATLYLTFGQGKAWILIPIATLTCLPIASFVTLQLPLLVDLIFSTYGCRIFVKHNDCRIKKS